MNVYSIKNKKGSDVEGRIKALLCAREVLKGRPDALILVDEADQMLCTFFSWILYGEKIDKGWLNTFLETSTAKVIWIANETFGTDESTLRRFSFTMDFKNLTSKERHQVWEHAIKSSGLPERLFPSSEVWELARTFRLNAGPISDALRTVATMQIPEEEARPVLNRILERYEEALGGPDAQIKRRHIQVCGAFGLEGLSISDDVSRVLTKISTFSERMKDSTHNGRLSPNINLLLSGPPGTGKTEFARYVARHIGRDLITKSASDLLSKWIGGTDVK